MTIIPGTTELLKGRSRDGYIEYFIWNDNDRTERRQMRASKLNAAFIYFDDISRLNVNNSYPCSYEKKRRTRDGTTTRTFDKTEIRKHFFFFLITCSPNKCIFFLTGRVHVRVIRD